MRTDFEKNEGIGGKRRIFLLLFFIGICSTILFFRLVLLHMVEGETLAQMASPEHQRVISLDGERGMILDRRGRVLAANTPVPSVYALPYVIEHPDALSSELSSLLQVGPETLLQRLQGKRQFAWLKRKIDPHTAQGIKKLGVEGIGIVAESQRFYPKKGLAAHLLGFVDVDNQGLEGIELAHNQDLRGERGWVVLERDARGRPFFSKDHTLAPPRRGKDIVLTIDEVVQYITERELDRVMKKTEAVSGSIIVMDPRDGSILAMAVHPHFNPNILSSYEPSSWRNRPVTDLFEPGSTFKIVVASAALEEGLFTPHDLIDCGRGFIGVEGKIIRDPFGRGGLMTFTEVIAHSNNVGAVKIARRLGEERLDYYIRRFGFGEKTGIDLRGEVSGLMRRRAKWSRRSWASLAIGQEVLVTPVQLITAAAAIANGGWLVTPHVVGEVREGGKGEARTPPLRRRVISERTAQEMRRILESGVVHGTGARAALEGYRVAGKTGTAQKVDPGAKRYSPDRAVSSFVGFVPAESPRLVILVVIDEPRGVSWGGSIAAPVFQSIAREVLLYLGIPPTTPQVRLEVGQG